MSWDRFFLVVQRTSNVLVILFCACAIVLLVQQWLAMRAFEQDTMRDDQKFGGGFQRTLPYTGEEIKTADGSLIAIFQEHGNAGERVELGGITITNATTGKAIELTPDASGGVVQFELIFEQGDGGKAVGYVATTATREQHAQGRMDLVVGALPAMTRSVVARNIRFSDLPRIRGDGSIGLLMWPEEGEAYLLAIRLKDGAVIERVKVKLPVLKENRLSQGPGRGRLAFRGGAGPAGAAAPESVYVE